MTDDSAPHPAAQTIDHGELATAYFRTPLPLLASVLELQSCGQLTLDTMRELIACDPGLTMRVLHTYHASGPKGAKGVVSIQEVLDDFDQQKLSRLLLSTATTALLRSSTPAISAALHAWWGHSLRCAMIAKALAELLDDPLAEAVYLAGLLHAIARWNEGKLSEDDTNISTSCKRETAIVEKKGEGRDPVDLGGLGAEVLAGLNVCSLVVDAVRYHDETETRIATAFAMTKLVYLAHLLTISNEKELARGVEMAKEFFGLSASQVCTCIQVVSRQFSEIAEKYGVSYDRDVDLVKMATDLELYRQQAIDYVTLQTVLQLPPRPNMSNMVCAIHQGLSQIFGINRIVCLFPDKKHTFLNAEGYFGCYSEDNIKNIQFPLNSERSLVVAAYRSETSTILSCKSLQSLADRQVMDILASDVLLCLPLAVPAADEKQGLILCGASQSQRAGYASLQEKLENFALQVAMKMSTCF